MGNQKMMRFIQKRVNHNFYVVLYGIVKKTTSTKGKTEQVNFFNLFMTKM